MREALDLPELVERAEAARLGISRASFDPPAKGFDRLKEELSFVKPTVVFLGYGMAASLQEMTDRSQDPTLNRDPARYGEEPMSAARFRAAGFSLRSSTW